MGKLAEKYTTQEKLDKDNEKEKDKTILSNDSYAICDFIESLINKIEHARISSLK
jgi:hypothetical protein